MMAERERARTKAQRRAKKERKRCLGLAIFAIMTVAVVFSGYFTYVYLNRSSPQTVDHMPFQPKAVIVDQLSLTFPNRTFIEKATNILKQAGYSVDYCPGERVTVEFYKNLPTHGYEVIVLRVHSALGANSSRPLALFSSENYSSTKYVYEQLAHQLARVGYGSPNSNDASYFGIGPEFIKSGMNGELQNATVFAMGCDGLTYTDMAEAFIAKGVKAFVGWFGPVSAPQTDVTIAQLLQHFFVEGKKLKESVQETFKEVGQDSLYKGLLIYYPAAAGEKTIENIHSKR